MRKKILFLILVLAFTIQPNLHELGLELIQTQKYQKALQYEVTVVLKLVQVFVTDKNGNPVTDLTKDDFILHDNGKLQTITDFEKHISAKPDKKVEETLEEVKFPPPQKIQTRMNRKFILLLDVERNSMRGLALSKKAALYFIDTQVQSTDEVGVFSYSSFGGLVIHEYLTTDHKKVIKAVKRLKGVTGMPPIVEGGLSAIIKPRGKEPERLSLKIPPIPTDAVARTNNFINNIKELAKVLRYIPGYKNIILYSGGVPGYHLFSPDQILRENYEEMGKELAAANSPVYSVSTLGAKRVRALDMLSDISGGKYLYKVEDYEKIATQIQNITSNYYALGYYIDETWDGKYHEIKVELKRKGYEVHAQSGYFNPKPFTELSKFEKELHLIELALSENPYFQEPYSLNLIALPCSGKKESNCVLISEIPLDDIEEVIKGKTEHANFIFDNDNNVIFSTRGDIDFSPFSQERIYSYAILSLPPGMYECRTIIRNLKTGRGTVASSLVEIPAPLKSGMRLYQPLLLIPEKKSVFIKLTKDSKKDAKKELLSLSDIYPFISNKHSPLINVSDKDVSKLLAVVRCSFVDIQKPEVNISALLVEHASKKKIPLSLSILSSENQEDTVVLLIELQLPELITGRYSLNIVAEEVNTQSKSEVNTDFSVR